MLHKHRKSSGGSGTRKVSPPGPVFMNEEQMANYLMDLRKNHPSRPLGSRPLPTKSATFSPATNSELPPRGGSALSLSGPSDLHSSVELPLNDPTPVPSLSHRRNNSAVPSLAIGGHNAGRPIARDPVSAVSRDPSPSNIKSSVIAPSVPYREDDSRTMERNEARSLRLALQEMDLQEEQRVHAAAQDEAADLVWQHRNPQAPGAPFRNPDFKARITQLEKLGHSRSQSLGVYGGLTGDRTQSSGTTQRSVSDSSSGSNSGQEGAEDSKKIQGSGVTKKPTVTFSVPPPASATRRRSSGQRSRNTSGESGKGLFRNPDDQIYEEPEDVETKIEKPPIKSPAGWTPLAIKARNVLPRGARALPERSSTDPLFTKKLSKYEIHKNPPTQSRNPAYNSNELPPERTESPVSEHQTKCGVEIRAEDIRAATSMRLKDRSPKLPQPTIVSDRPGRPIVSFDPSWKPADPASEPRGVQNEQPSPHPSSQNAFGSSRERNPLPTHTQAAPVIPTIQLPEEESVTSVTVATCVPSIAIDCEPSAPMIQVSDGAFDPPSTARPLPIPKKDASHRNNRGVGPHTRPAPTHTTPYSYRQGPTATCTACALPIAGRIVTACSHRFHPECFSCHHCSEPLECVAFYPEPEDKRTERIASGSEDSDDGLRFYCHLDFHEFFSPRCRSCKTPIEGEVIVAAGGEWHVGHFFCAECGDFKPFDAKTPFVEKDGYAWCVGCHSKRTASRCRGCKKLVMDEVVITALEGQWHADCFVCVECRGGFGDEGRFFVRIGADGKEVGVCEGCEGRRLKA